MFSFSLSLCLCLCLSLSLSLSIDISLALSVVSVFAEFGKVSHIPLCDAVMSVLTRHSDKEIVVQKSLSAVGFLALSHPDNNVL